MPLLTLSSLRPPTRSRTGSLPRRRQLGEDGGAASGADRRSTACRLGPKRGLLGPCQIEAGPSVSRAGSAGISSSTAPVLPLPAAAKTTSIT